MKLKRTLVSLMLTAAVLLSGCVSNTSVEEPDDDTLTWVEWSGYDAFFDFLNETYPDIEIKKIAYVGANLTGYSWAQMRADDIPDLFSTSLILDDTLAKERLVDLSEYSFVAQMSTSILDQVSIDGGIYLLPIRTSVIGIYYNKTLMEEYGWTLPQNFDELETLCAKIKTAGLIPGVIGTQLTGNTFSAVFNLAKTDWLTTPEGVKWERDFLNGDATAAGMWEGTMAYVQRYIDIGMFNTDPEELGNLEMIDSYLGERKAVFVTVAGTPSSEILPNGDELGMMPYISEDGSKNVYMYSVGGYIGISKRLLEPGNENKLEKAIQLLSLLFSDEGQAVVMENSAPCMMGVSNNVSIPENSILYDASQAMRNGKAFPMTYVHWENVLSDIGQAFKEWFCGENEMDGDACIARMDKLQGDYLHGQNEVYFCESTTNFTLEETATLVGKVLGSSVGADAALVPYGTEYKTDSSILKTGVSGTLYAESINLDVCNTIAPGADGKYAIMEMTGDELTVLWKSGLSDAGESYPYALALRGGGEPKSGSVYRVAFPIDAYTDETAETYSAIMEKGSLRIMLHTWFAEQKTVSPDGNPWN